MKANPTTNRFIKCLVIPWQNSLWSMETRKKSTHFKV